MQPPDDSALLRQFAENESDEAFAALVTRHINLVYSVALRQVGNSHNAEEITQAVFIILAKKAAQLRHGKTLSSWLFQTTRLTANNFARGEVRRRHREEEAYMQSVLNESASEIWPKIAPLLDSAVADLREQERRAILLRFCEGRNLREVGVALGASENAAEKRVNRALEKLRKFFAKRGVNSTTAGIAGGISINSVQTAPVALAKTVTIMAMAKGATASASALTLIKGALKIMAWTKVKTATVVVAGILIAAGTTTVTVKEIEARKTYDWQVSKFDSQILQITPPQVRIVPTRFSQFGGSGGNSGRFMGIAASITNMITLAYSNSTPARTIFEAKPPQGRYDFIANLPAGSAEALKQEIKKQFGLAGKFETRDAEVWLLKARRSNAPGLKPATEHGHGDWIGNGELSCHNQPMTSVASDLEGYFGIPIIDETGMNSRFDVDLHWDEQSPRQNPDGLKQALLDELGLELVPSRAPVEMLVIEKAQ